MKSPVPLRCLVHKLPLILNKSEDKYLCCLGCVFPAIKEIPRFVSEDNYAHTFGVQWNAFRTVQLDSYTDLTISRERLTRLMGGTLDVLEGKKVIDAGWGAGRFTEILLNAGASVFAVDLSSAVEANYENCKQYSYEYPITPLRRLLRWFLLRYPGDFALWFCRNLVKSLWPFRQLFWKYRNLRGIHRLRSAFLYFSPVIDYHDAYPQLGPNLLRTWAILDLHDTVTDVFKHFRSAEEISDCLHECGMCNIETVYAGNGVEGRGQKPVNLPDPLRSAMQSVNRRGQ